VIAVYTASPTIRYQHPEPILFRPRDELLPMAAPIHDQHGLHRLPTRHDEVSEPFAIHGPFPIAVGDVTGARRDSLAVFVEPNGRGHVLPNHSGASHPVERGKRKWRCSMTTDEVEKLCRLIRNACTENTQDQPHEADDLKGADLLWQPPRSDSPSCHPQHFATSSSGSGKTPSSRSSGRL
jgi:hypothetical protein